MRAFVTSSPPRHDLAWEAFEKTTENQKKAALRALSLLTRLQNFRQAGWNIDDAIMALKADDKISRASLMRWQKIVKNVPHEHWLAYLTPRKRGPKGPRYQCSEEAWSFLKRDWLRAKKPTISACYRRVSIAAERNGWVIPSKKTFSRWLAYLPNENMVPIHEELTSRKKSVPEMKKNHSDLCTM